MDLIDKVNQTRFLGKEFLTWLWYRSDRQEGLFRVEGQPETFELWLDDKLVLDTAIEKVKEVSSIRGESPTETAEAKAALSMGKKVAEARLRIVLDQREWMVTVKGEDLALAGIKVPALLSREEDEKVLERLELVEELELLLDRLYSDFVRLRLEKDRWRAEVAAMREWVEDRR